MVNCNEYVQIATPDKLEIAHLIDIAKGPKRTQEQYAQACGISAPTLSRIVNGKNKKPLSVDIIKKLCANAFEKGDELFRMIIRANGMVCKEDHDRRALQYDRHRYTRANELKDLYAKIKNIIVTKLFDIGAVFSCIKASPNRFRSRTEIAPGIYLEYDLCIQLAADQTWFFCWSGREYEIIGSILFADAYKQNKPLEGIKITFVFADGDRYERFFAGLEGFWFRPELSAILIDIPSERVLSERWLPSNYAESSESIFNRPKAEWDFDEPYDYDEFEEVD